MIIFPSRQYDWIILQLAVRKESETRSASGIAVLEKQKAQSCCYVQMNCATASVGLIGIYWLSR